MEILVRWSVNRIYEVFVVYLVLKNEKKVFCLRRSLVLGCLIGGLGYCSLVGRSR